MSDFHFTSTQPLKLGTTTEKYQGNLEAIRILKRCTAENRPATLEEQAVLSRYVGWGDAALLRQLSTSEELRSLLTEDEMRAARGSSLNAHYTALPVIGAIWEALAHLGLPGPDLRILDPSAGIGHFKSAAPDGFRQASWVEIELDRLTAGILRLLHPESKVYAQGYETVGLPDGWFDLAISNVPFGDYGVSSKKLPAYLRSAIHDFFFANTVSLLRPGGVMAFITSRYTLDKKETQVRQWLAHQLDLLAVVRLPCTAFKANAGTEVVTDILILQKRKADAGEGTEPSGEPEWVQTAPVEVRGKYVAKKLLVNAYYARQPEMVLGVQALTGTMYGSDGYNVEPDGRDLGEAIREALLAKLPKGWIHSREAVTPETAPAIEIITTARARSAEQEARLEGLHEIYRAAKAVLAAETEGKPVAEVDRLRVELNRVYDRFLAENGPPLDMDDDRVPGILEGTSGKKPKRLDNGLTRRTITEMYPGRHQGIIPLSLWQTNQQERKSRGTTPVTDGRPIHEYMLSGVAFCWECHSYDGRQASLRGITGNRYQYYRCATMIGEYKSRKKPRPEMFGEAISSLGMNVEEEQARLELVDRHRSTLQKQVLEEQVSQLVEKLEIPADWYELILAYYLSDKGMSEFELRSYNLRQELTRQRELFKRGHITQAEYEQAYLHIDRQLQRLQPSAQPDAREVVHLLKDFAALWRKMTLTERRAILQAMFAGMYFDSDHQLRKISAHSPFDRLLGIKKQAEELTD